MKKFKKIYEQERQLCIDRLFSHNIKNVYELFTNFLIENQVILYGSTLLSALSNQNVWHAEDIDLVCEYTDFGNFITICKQLANIISYEYQIDTYGINTDYSNKKVKSYRQKSICVPNIFKVHVSNKICYNTSFMLEDLVENTEIYSYNIHLVMLKKGITQSDYILSSDFSILQNYFDGIDIFICDKIANIKNMTSTYFLECNKDKDSCLINSGGQYRIKKYLKRNITLSKIYCKNTGEKYYCKDISWKKRNKVKNLFIFYQNQNLDLIMDKFTNLESVVIYKDNSPLEIKNLPPILKKIRIYVLNNIFFDDTDYFSNYLFYYGDELFKQYEKNECEVKIKLPFGCTYFLNDNDESCKELY